MYPSKNSQKISGEIGDCTVLEKTQTKITAFQAQADAIDVKLAERKAADVPQPGVLEVLQANDSVNRLMKDRGGRAVVICW